MASWIFKYLTKLDAKRIKKCYLRFLLQIFWVTWTAVIKILVHCIHFMYWEKQIFFTTAAIKINRLDHNIWMNFWQPPVHAKRFSDKLLVIFLVHIFTLLLAYFASKLFNYSRHSETFKIQKNSVIGDISLWWQRFFDFQTKFEKVLYLELLTNLGTKCAKRSVKMWRINLY